MECSDRGRVDPDQEARWEMHKQECLKNHKKKQQDKKVNEAQLNQYRERRE